MRFSCENGYYKFYPESIPALNYLKDIFGLKNLVQEKDYYTFEALKNMQEYSVLGYPFGLGIAKATYHGTKERLLQRNGLVYNLALNNITEAALSLNFPAISKADFYALRFIPQAGCLVDGRAYTSFYGEIDLNTGIVKIEQFYNND